MKAYVCREDASEGFIEAVSAEEAKKIMCNQLEDECGDCEGPRLVQASCLEECPVCGRTPIYTQVKPEDVVPEWYWVVKPNGHKNIRRIFFSRENKNLGTIHPDGWMTISKMNELGWRFYKIPSLDLEVAE